MENFIKDFLDSLNQYSNLLIVDLTIAIVYLTYRSARSGQEALRINSLPILFPKISNSSKTSTLTLENHSDFPAYDLSLQIIGVYHEDEIPYKSLLDKKYRGEVKIDFLKSLYSYESEWYGISDHVEHYAFPPKTKCVMDLDFSVPPNSFDLILQFRDTMGQNYLYQSWLFRDNFKKVGNLKLGSFETNFKPSKRINRIGAFSVKKELHAIFQGTRHVFFLLRGLRLVPLALEFWIAKIRSQIYLKKDVKDILLRTFPSGYQKNNNSLWSEGRGVFTEI